MSEEKPRRIITGNELNLVIAKALNLDISKVRRIIIDAGIQTPVLVYVEYYGDSRLLEIGWSDHRSEMEIRTAGKE